MSCGWSAKRCAPRSRWYGHGPQTAGAVSSNDRPRYATRSKDIAAGTVGAAVKPTVSREPPGDCDPLQRRCWPPDNRPTSTSSRFTTRGPTLRVPDGHKRASSGRCRPAVTEAIDTFYRKRTGCNPTRIGGRLIASPPPASPAGSVASTSRSDVAEKVAFAFPLSDVSSTRRPMDANSGQYHLLPAAARAMPTRPLQGAGGALREARRSPALRRWRAG